MRRVRMLEKQTAWKREGGFDGIEIIAEMHGQTLRHLHAGVDSDHLYAGLYTPQWPPTLEEFTLDTNVEVESLKIEVLHSQPSPLLHMIYRRDGRPPSVRGWTNLECIML